MNQTACNKSTQLQLIFWGHEDSTRLCKPISMDCLAGIRPGGHGMRFLPIKARSQRLTYTSSF